MPNRSVRVLLIEDNPGDARLIREMLKETAVVPFDLVVAERLRQGLELVASQAIHVVLLDLSLPDSHGLDTLSSLLAHAPLVPVIVMTGTADEELAVEAVKRGAQDYLIKGQVESAWLIRAVRYAIERKEAEEQIRLLSRFPDENPNPVLRLAADGTVSYANSAAEGLLNDWGIRIGGVAPSGILPLVRGILASGETLEREIETADHCYACCFTPIVERGYVNLYGRDVTERKRAEQERSKLESQLQQAMKMEAIGRLAGGIAHDFNNLLTGISGNAQLAMMGLTPGDPLAEPLEEISKAAHRASTLTRQLLAFSRKQIVEPKIVDLNSLIDNLQRMLVRLIGEDIKLTTELPKGVGTIKVDPGQMEQLIINLAVNARDAMPDGGELLIRTADTEDVPTNAELPQGRYVRLSVSDTGSGMSEEVKRHLFEPFFTTKPVGRGTGLGLAIIHGVVKQSSGHIRVVSQEGEGTTFHILLPRVDGAAENPTRTSATSALPRGTETILLVEDEAIVRNLAQTVLKRLGYTVLSAVDGSEGLQRAQAQREHLDLLLTDVVMPGMNGRQLAEQVVQLHPETTVLFTSGYPETALAGQEIADQHLNFIGKPYTPVSLAQKIRDVLDKPPATPFGPPVST